MYFPDGIVCVNNRNLIRRFLEPLDGAFTAVDTDSQAVVMAHRHLRRPVYSGGAVVIFHQNAVVVIQYPPGHNDIHLSQKALNLKPGHGSHRVLHMGA